MSCSLPHASAWLHHSASEHPVLGAGLSSTGTAGALMGAEGVFWGGEDGGDQRESLLGWEAVQFIPWSQWEASALPPGRAGEAGPGGGAGL